MLLRDLSDIWQQSLQSGDVLVDCKLENVVPVLKKGKKKDPDNYRCLNLPLVPEKIMESLF